MNNWMLSQGIYNFKRLQIWMSVCSHANDFAFFYFLNMCELCFLSAHPWCEFKVNEELQLQGYIARLTLAIGSKREGLGQSELLHRHSLRKVYWTSVTMPHDASSLWLNVSCQFTRIVSFVWGTWTMMVHFFFRVWVHWSGCGISGFCCSGTILRK